MLTLFPFTKINLEEYSVIQGQTKNALLTLFVSVFLLSCYCCLFDQNSIIILGTISGELFPKKSLKNETDDMKSYLQLSSSYLFRDFLKNHFTDMQH